MRLRSLFKVPKHQQYQYKPRYWNPEKEELHERLQKIEDLKNAGTDGMKARISSGLKRGYLADSKYRNKQLSKSNLLLLVVLIFLLGACYVFLTVYLPGIVESIEGKG